MKLINFSKKIMITILALIVSLSVFSGCALADNENKDLLQYNLGVRFEQDQSNEKLIHIIIEMSDEDSIASFNISADIDVEEEAEVVFNFNDTNIPDSDLKQADISEITNVDGKKTKELNIYYVGTKELNPDNSNRLEIGTLEFRNVNGDNTTIKIDSVEEKSAISAISYKDNTLNINEFTAVLNKKDNSGDSGNQGDDGNQGGQDDQGSQGNLGGDGNTGNNGGSSSNGGASQNNGGSSSNGNGSENNGATNPFKTGANKSVTWAIITLVVLIIVAIFIKKKKQELRKKTKHSK